MLDVILAFLSHEMEGDPKYVCHGLLKETKKKQTRILCIFFTTHKALRRYLFFREDLKLVTSPCFPSLTPPFPIKACFETNYLAADWSFTPGNSLNSAVIHS